MPNKLIAQKRGLSTYFLHTVGQSVALPWILATNCSRPSEITDFMKSIMRDDSKFYSNYRCNISQIRTIPNLKVYFGRYINISIYL